MEGRTEREAALAEEAHGNGAIRNSQRMGTEEMAEE